MKVGRIVIKARRPAPPATAAKIPDGVRYPLLNGRYLDMTDVTVEVVSDDGECLTLVDVTSLSFKAVPGEALSAQLTVLPSVIECEAWAHLEVAPEPDGE